MRVRCCKNVIVIMYPEMMPFTLQNKLFEFLFAA